MKPDRQEHCAGSIKSSMRLPAHAFEQGTLNHAHVIASVSGIGQGHGLEQFQILNHQSYS